jgi:hypothetical protein
MNDFLITAARFHFFNGKLKYTVDYCFGLRKWYVFKDDMQTHALFNKEDKKIKLKDINLFAAQQVLNDYLETL